MYNLKKLKGRFSTDTFYPKVKSLHQSTCVQIFSHKVRFAACYPSLMRKGTESDRHLVILYMILEYPNTSHMTGLWYKLVEKRSFKNYSESTTSIITARHLEDPMRTQVKVQLGTLKDGCTTSAERNKSRKGCGTSWSCGYAKQVT